MLTRFDTSRVGLSKAILLSTFFATCLYSASAQQPAATAPATAAARQIGTVKAISGNTISLATDSGQQVSVTLADSARIVQLPPGSTDLKAATPATAKDIAVGDRVLVTGKPGDVATQLTAARVVLMKSNDIAQKRAQEQADWQKRGSGGIVSAIDPGKGTLTVAEGAKKVEVKTSGTTIFRRYAGDSIKFEDAVPGTFSQLQVGDQLRVRGTKSDDGASVQAEEIVSGSFKNLAGLIASIDAASGTITLKDLATKKMMTVKLTANSDLRALPERAAAMFAARARGGASGAGAAAAANAGGASPRGPGGGGPDGAGRSAGMDLSQMLSRLPKEPITDLKVGEAVMIVALQSAPSSTSVTAVTLLSGVEPILAASPTGEGMTLSPWGVGGGGPEEGGAQ